MRSIVPLIPISSIVLVGAAVAWANTRRVLNRVFFSFSVHAGFWLLCVHLAVVSGEDETWVRLASALGACITPHMWLLKEAILRRASFWRGLSRRKYLWFGSAAVLVALCYTRWYIRAPSISGGKPQFGPAYFINTLAILGLYAVLWQETRRQIRRNFGLNRLELQILLLGGTATAFAVIVLMALRAILGAVWPIQLQPFVVSVLWFATVVATTTHRVLDARQIVMFIAQKLVLAVVAGSAALGTDWILHSVGAPEVITLLGSVAAAVWLGWLVGESVRKKFRVYPEAVIARQAAFAAAQRASRPDELEQAFKSVLHGWGRSDLVVLLSDLKQGTKDVEGSPRAMLLEGMRHLNWATPERLMRERTTPEREVVGRFLTENALHVLVLAEGPALTLLVGVGATAPRLPFTYPQVTQLLELASIMEGALERAHFSIKAQHAEQLATVGLLGASVAHEIRNPLVTIKSFVQLLPGHYDDPKFRDKFFRLIADEVNRIDRLTEQLLDLASPRAYSATLVELHPILQATLDLVATKAAHKQVEIVAELEANPDVVHTDSAAAKQVILNLCFNAIQALDAKEEGPRRVWLKTRKQPASVEVIVADNGPGIAPELLPRLFQPFQTTKSSGFGLGLAICSDILTNLDASISVDPPLPGQGAVFRVNFPCQRS